MDSNEFIKKVSKIKSELAPRVVEGVSETLSVLRLSWDQEYLVWQTARLSYASGVTDGLRAGLEAIMKKQSERTDA